MNTVLLNTIPLDNGKVIIKKGGAAGGGGSGTLQPNDVNFYDYDGTLLYAYSWEEAKKLTELPPAPSYKDGNTFIEWNYTLEDIKRQGVKYFTEYFGQKQHVYSYITELTIDGVTYQAYNSYGCFEHYDYGPQYWALLTLGDPVEGGKYCYAESFDSGATWEIEKDENGEPYWYDIIKVGEVKGHADIGAVTNNSYEVTDDTTVINEKCVVVPTTLEYDDFTIRNRAPHSILCLANKYDPYVCYIEANTDRLVIPRDFIFGQNYEYVSNSVIDELYVNGSDVGYYILGEMNIVKKLCAGPYINLGCVMDNGNPVGVLKIGPNTAALVSVAALIIDCSDCVVVPVLDGVATASLVSVIIPASLEEEFSNATGWSELTDKFIIDKTK